MATRCQIAIYSKKPTINNGFCDKFKNFDVLLYRHWSGDPESVIECIKPFLEDFHSNRGMIDTEYLGARLIQYLCNKTDEELLQYRKRNNIKEKVDFTGYGISKDFHGDIEYFYVIYPGGIHVYKVTNTVDSVVELIEKLNILNTITILRKE